MVTSANRAVTQHNFASIVVKLWHQNSLERDQESLNKWLSRSFTSKVYSRFKCETIKKSCFAEWGVCCERVWSSRLWRWVVQTVKIKRYHGIDSSHGRAVSSLHTLDHWAERRRQPFPFGLLGFRLGLLWVFEILFKCHDDPSFGCFWFLVGTMTDVSRSCKQALFIQTCETLLEFQVTKNQEEAGRVFYWNCSSRRNAGNFSWACWVSNRASSWAFNHRCNDACERFLLKWNWVSVSSW